MADILELLLSAEQISQSTLTTVALFCKRWGVSGFHGLLETNVFDEQHLADTLAGILKLDRVYNLASHETGAEARGLVPYDFAAQWECLPNLIAGRGQLELVIADPTQAEPLAYLQKHLSCGVVLAVGTRSEIVRALDDYYPLNEQLPFLKRELKHELKRE